MTSDPAHQPTGDSPGLPPTDRSCPWHFEFTTTAQMPLDARAAAGSVGLNTVGLVGDIALVVVGIVFALAGYVLGYLSILFGVLLLFFAQVQPIQRWLIRRYRGSLVGQAVTVDISDETMLVATPFSSTTIPWSTVNKIRSTERIVVFLRDRAMVGYLPAAAFTSDSERREFAEYARERVTTARSTQ